ncbi:hypothetical protein CYMTET_8787 [Cymbomonas tetramitiformis]|uniref:Glutaredoxin domain-containing protein n=1 Tax=Cymbomonas tetramitiformis TaxID=36881 RepID=A0AAE0LFH6_9CHLO|nr:hypothetical protein CYMTET_8787 [Cymbomonas tetramitiformis]
MSTVKLFSTSVPSTQKLKGDISTLKWLLDSKKTPYEEIDLAVDNDRREEMRAVSNKTTLPQLHINGEAYCDVGQIQEMEDNGELRVLLGQ